MNMKATGIVRRIDDLGRIVIPKEIRRILGIREGMPMELFTSDKGVVFQPFRPEQDIRQDIKDIIKSLTDFDEYAYEDIIKKLEEAEQQLCQIEMEQ